MGASAPEGSFPPGFHRIENDYCRPSRSLRPQQPHELRRQRCKLHLRRPALRVYDDVPSCRYLLPMAAHNLSHPPPDAIAHYRAAQRLLDAEAVSAAFHLIRAKENGEIAARA